jgi:hypothetical protein
MPIRKELRQFYGREWRTVTRPRILARAGNRCEQCGKPNHCRVYVWKSSLPARQFHADQYWTLRKRDQEWHYCSLNGATGNFQLFGPGQWRQARRIRVVLTIAHLNHVSGDDRDENLKALCQWCHLNYDKSHHAETRAIRKDAARPLLQGMLA